MLDQDLGAQATAARLLDVDGAWDVFERIAAQTHQDPDSADGPVERPDSTSPTARPAPAGRPRTEGAELPPRASGDPSDGRVGSARWDC